MAEQESSFFTATPRSLSGLAVVFLLFAALFALMNGQKMKALRADLVTSRASVPAKANVPTNGTTGQSKPADADRATTAEAALTQAEKDKADLKGKLDASQQEIAALRQRAAGATTNSSPSAPGTVTAPAENAQNPALQSQIDDLRRQLDGAEKEKTLLAEKLQDAQDRPAAPKEAPKAETRKRRETASARRESGSRRTGVRGTVLAYNQAYNFVVLNLGARNGVGPPPTPRSGANPVPSMRPTDGNARPSRAPAVRRVTGPFLRPSALASSRPGAGR